MKSLLVITLFLFPFINAEITHFERGLDLYSQRANESLGLKANKKFIDQAIDQFLKAMKTPDGELEAGVYLLKCYYYKGKFVSDSNDTKKEIFSMGKSLGEQLISRHPQSVESYYWYLVNLGSWAEIYGTMSAAKEGVAGTMRKFSKKIIDIDSNYNDGGGYFMLGAVHFKSPYIPFILSWPSNDKALKYLTLAYNTGESTPNQAVYLARALHKNGQTTKAISLLSSLLKEDVSESNKLEDMDQYGIARGLLKEWE
ncbi:MAG: tetratricopeptide repeat protein [Candidatus Neomarinimicrobiota bacterium]